MDDENDRWKEEKSADKSQFVAAADDEGYWRSE